MPQFRSPINLNLPTSPQDLPEELQSFGQQVFNALRQLQSAIGNFSGVAYTDPTYFNSLSLPATQSVNIQNLTAIRMQAFQTIGQGKLVTLKNDAGTVKMDLASAAGIATRAIGWAPQQVLIGDFGLFYLWLGLNPNYSILTLATTYYLSASSPGGVSSVAPVASGTIKQEVGQSISPTEILVRLSTPIINP